MRGSIALAFVWFLGVATAIGAPQDDFAQRLAGPWGRVDQLWQPLSGALSKGSCPLAGVRRPDTIGLFGEGGAMWIEPAYSGALNVYDGGAMPHLLSFVQMTSTGAAVYREAGVERLYTLIGPDQLSESRMPQAPGQPATNYARCLKKK